MMQKHLAKNIFGLLIFVGGLSSCNSSVNFTQPQSSGSVAHSTASQKSNSKAFTTLEQSVYKQINQFRSSRKLPPLTLDSRISEQARIHSEAMASGRVPFGHNGFEGRVNALSKSIAYRAAGENVAYNQGYSSPDQQAVQGWLKSPGHFKNIVGNFDLTGIGIAKNANGEYYFTQIFVKRR